MAPIPVILDHDGGHDDLVALALLMANPQKVKIIGCTVTDADCFADHAFDASGRLMAMMHCTDGADLFPIGRCSFKGVNPFPTEWRWAAANMRDLPCLNIPKHVDVWKKHEAENKKLVGERLMADLVMNSKEKVTICVTGPLSCVAWCIENYGEQFTKNVAQCIIMGGAVDVKGNVFATGKNGTAEWNIFWDPPAAKVVLGKPQFETVLFALDATNDVPVNSAVVQVFGQSNNYLLSQFVGSAWSSCTHLELARPGDGYYAWDVLTAAYAIDKSIASLTPVDLEVVTDTLSPCEGRTFRSTRPCGQRSVMLATNTQAKKFYNLMYSSMRRGLQSKL